MLVRTFVLSICMVVVPAMAMFSHHVPADLRTAARCDLWQPLMQRVRGWFGPAGPMAGEPVAASGAEPLAATVTPTAVAAVPATDGAADGDRAGATALGIDSADGTRRLESLGGLAIDCRPLEGVGGMHVASCRVAMDAAGQLHRIFQAAGPDPTSATEALADQVAAWRERLADRSGGSARPPGLQ
jgi:hypothetical protein